MPDQPPKIRFATFVCVLLALYALGYAWLLFMAVQIGAFSVLGAAPLFALALTPFASFYHLAGVEDGTLGRGAWVMAGIMALPTLFFGYFLGVGVIEALTKTSSAQSSQQFFLVFGLFAPAALSGFLCLTFVLAARRT